MEKGAPGPVGRLTGGTDLIWAMVGVCDQEEGVTKSRRAPRMARDHAPCTRAPAQVQKQTRNPLTNALC